MRHFCTLFNAAYQYHSRLLYESICANDDINNLQFYFVCFDADSLNYFKALNLKNVNLISSEELENYFPQLKKVKPKRGFAEYFFTSTPAICKYVFEKYPAVDEIVYLDADLLFFQSPEILFTEIGNSSVSIIPHRFNLINSFRNVYGYYNVGWISFKKDVDGIACLDKWFENTIDWCFDKLTFRRYADQKYLNYWKRDFNNVYVIKNKGANVAPWNVGNYKVRKRQEAIYVDDIRLVFFHFASLKVVDNAYYTTISSYFSFVTKEVKTLIYRPYISALLKLGFVPRISVRLNKNLVITRLRKMIRRFYSDSIVTGNQELK